MGANLVGRCCVVSGTTSQMFSPRPHLEIVVNIDSICFKCDAAGYYIRPNLSELLSAVLVHSKCKHFP